MSGKNGGIRQIYNLIGGRDRGSESDEWFHVPKAGSGKSVLCAAPRSTMKDVEAAKYVLARTLGWPLEKVLKTLCTMIVEEIDAGKIVLADAAADESGLDKYAILAELDKIKFLPERLNRGLPPFGGEIKVMEVGDIVGIQPSFYSTIIFSVLYELLNGSAVILISSKANVFCYYFGKMILNAVKNTGEFFSFKEPPFEVFSLIHAKDGGLADEVLGEMLDGKFYKIGNGIVVPKRK